MPGAASSKQPADLSVTAVGTCYPGYAAAVYRVIHLGAQPAASQLGVARRRALPRLKIKGDTEPGTRQNSCTAAKDNHPQFTRLLWPPR